MARQSMVQGQFTGYSAGFNSPVVTRITPETAQAAKERAAGLLKSLLRPEQWAELEAHGTITERIGGGEFVLRRGHGQMIEVRKRGWFGRRRERWCVYPDSYHDGNDFMPDEDRLIGQLLHLRASPEKLRSLANVFQDQ